MLMIILADKGKPWTPAIRYNSIFVTVNFLNKFVWESILFLCQLWIVLQERGKLIC